MLRYSQVFGLTVIVLIAAHPSCRAATITYDPSTGLLPDQAGWVYTQTGGGPTSIAATGGLLSLNVGVTPRGSWNYNLLSAGNSPGQSIFMESTVRVISESHTSSNRGVSIFELENTTQGASGYTNEVDGYAWSNKIFWTNSVGTVVGSATVDTSTFHTYRLELDGNNAFVYVDGQEVGAVLNNSYLNGDPSQPDVLRAHFGDSTVASGSVTDWQLVRAGLLSDGITETSPVLPSDTIPPGTGGSVDGVYVFNNVPSGRWYDPPIANGFVYTMTSGDHFTSIQDFPTGFNNPFTVTAEGQSWSGSPGSPVDFLALLGHGVSSFSISGISPGVDATDSSAFPLLLNFDSTTASFTMAAVPEPSTFVMLSTLFATITAVRARRAKKPASSIAS